MAIKIIIGTAFNPKGLKQAQTGFQKFSSSIGKGLAVAGVAAAAALTIGAVGAKFAKMAEEAEVANRRLDQIASSMGIFGDQATAVTDRLKAYANANKFVLGADDEVIKSTQAKLLTFKNLAATADEAGGAFDRATQAAFDMAAAGFGQAESNAVQLGKALENPIKGITALTRSGITFTESEKAFVASLVQSGNTLKAQEFILAAIETQVGGTAAATATASTKMNIAFSEIGESIGTAVLPMFTAFADGVVAITPQIESFFGSLTDPTTEVGEKWFAMSSAIVEFGNTFMSVFEGIDAAAVMGFIADAVETVSIGLSELIWVAGDAGKTLGMLFSGDFAGAGAQVSSFFTRYNKFVSDLYKKIDAGAAKMAADSTKRFQVISGPKTTFTVPAAGSPSAKKALKKAAKDAAKAAAEAAAAAAAEAAAELKKLKDAFRDSLTDALKGISFKKATAELGQFEQEVKTAFDGIIQTIKDADSKILDKRKKIALLGLATFVQDQLLAIAKQRDAMAARIEKTKSFMQSVIDSVMGSATISQLGNTSRLIISSLQKIVTKTIKFREQITKLQSMGLGANALQQIIEAGSTEGGATATALLAGGESAIAQVNDLYSQLDTVSNSLAETAGTILYGSGVDAGNGLVNGLMAQEEELRKAAETLGKTFSRYFGKGAGVGSLATDSMIGVTGTTRGGTVVNLTVNAPMGTGQNIGRLIIDEISRFERSSGAVFARA